MPLIQLFIATYNRPSSVLNAIRSALDQDFDSYEVIVSDNSTNDETQLLISQINDKRLLYKRRKPSLPALGHLNAILKDITSDYFMIFHDDDTLHNDMIKNLYSTLIKNRNAVAIGSNAKVIKKGIVQKKNYYPNLKSIKLINNRDEFIKCYLLYHMVPFPSYLYKNIVAQKLCFNPEQGGKYCDAAFIINLLSLGKVIFLPNPLMDYYIHQGQDSNSNDFNQKIKLISYYIKTSSYTKKHPLIIRFRIQNIFTDVKESILNKEFSLYSRKNINKIRLIFKYSPFEYFPRILMMILKNKLINDK